MMKKQLTSRELLKLWFYTLFYNSDISWTYAMDTIVEPLFYLADNITGYIGRMFVFIVAILVGSVVVIAHLIGVPVYLEKSPLYLGVLIIIGYWIVINLVFNFVQAVRVSPGLPNNPKLLSTSVTICKKCIAPKPIRTHHCSICNLCYLKMDHHCPWLNNCVGHFNHRYFYLTMIYITVGCLFISLFGVSLAYEQIILEIDILPFIKSDSTQEVTTSDSENDETSTYDEYTKLLFNINVSRRFFIVIFYYTALICVGAIISLGGLSIWHGLLISRGETSIEYHINKASLKRLGNKFSNPYNLGRRKNWEVFLGLDQSNVSFCKNILLPSTHTPTGNGYEWSHLTSKIHKFSSIAS